MKVVATKLPGVLVFEPEAHVDVRGWLIETWQSERYAAHGLPRAFAQDNVVGSAPGVVRGLHLQHPEGQGKLIQALRGDVFDVAVDVRVGSPTFAKWVGVSLSGANRRQVWVPPGFAHGYCVEATSPPAVLAYKMSAYYRPEHEITVRWNDPAIGIRWPVTGPLVSPKDAAAPLLADMERTRLPVYRAPP